VCVGESQKLTVAGSKNHTIMYAKVVCIIALSFCISLNALPRTFQHRIVAHSNNGLERRLSSIEQKFSSIGRKVSCSLCKMIVGFLKYYIDQGSTENEIVKALTKVCIYLKIEDQRVCYGVVREFKEEVLTVFDTAVVTPGDICGTILGPSCAKAGTAYGPWNVTFPKPTRSRTEFRNRVRNFEATGTVSKVLQISDTHVDPIYMEGANTKCGEPLCCRKTDGLAPKGVTPAGKFGYYNCDTPVVTLDNLFQHIKDYHKDIDYIIWTGDVPPHNIWNQSKDDQISALKFAGETLLKYFPDMKIYPALGNHEGAPVNSFPPSFVKEPHSNLWLRNALADLWGKWLPAETKETILKGGYYTTLVRKGLRIISINMNYCNNMNWWLLINNTDPGGQLQWMIGVLEQAEKNNEKVHVLGHIPPGSGDCLKHWSWNYYEIITRYSHVITAQFFGHTHHDEFQIFYEDSDVSKPASIAYIGPSVTPYTHLNPGYRIYEVDGDHENSTQVVLDHATYIIDLAKANKEGKASWELEYKAKEAYGMKSLLPSDWNDLVNRMSKNDTLFQMFNTYFYKSYPEPCIGNCKTATLCRLKSARSSDYEMFCKFQDEAVHKWYKMFNYRLRKC